MRLPAVVVCTLLAGVAAWGAGCSSGSSGAPPPPASRCGDGVTGPGEVCDDGNDVPGDGCEPGTCRFSCANPAADCGAPPPCRRAVCTAAHVCAILADAALDGTGCGPGETCRAGVCAPSTCGDGTVEAGLGEECEPPATPTCSPTCLDVRCGDGHIQPGEQCDDSNVASLDGCDASCRYEVVLRVTSLAVQGTSAPASCTPVTNRLGAQALSGLARSSLNASIADSIGEGTLNLLLQLIGLDDLTGVADPDGVSVGVLGGAPDPARGAWPANAPIDGWFLADPAGLSDAGPTGLLTNGTLAARRLSAGPNDVALALALGGAPASLTMRGARLALTLDGTPAPDVPAPPPAALAAGLTVFRTATGTGAGAGLCGNVTVESLARMPAPEMLTTGGSTPCTAVCPGSRAYAFCGAGQPVGPACNSMLDVLVGGCRGAACLPIVNAQQPDVPATAGAAVRTLSLGAGNKVPANQTDGNVDAYSAYFALDAIRAHLTGVQQQQQQ